jgi:methylglutaconyl-CoA hydratase
MEGHVHLHTTDGIATIEFYHPQSNSMPGHLLRQLAHTVEAAGADPAARVIVLRSAGTKAFCAGASFDELMSITDLEQGRLFFSGFAGVINAIRKAPKFVLCRVQGKAVGGGVGIASAADYTFGTQDSAVKLSELAVGIGPFVVGPAVERKVGRSAFAQLSIDAANWRSAQWARDNGLYADVYADAGQMDAAISTLAQRLAGSSPEAMAQLKRVLWQGTEHWDTLLAERAEVSGRLVLSDFTRQFIAHFKQGQR